MSETPARTAPFAAFEWAIAWRYLRARRQEGGISVIAWYALIGVMLGVATLIVVQAVMVGFREEFTDRILGANAHVTIYSTTHDDASGVPSRLIRDYDAMAERAVAVPGVTRAAPLVKGQVMASAPGRNIGVEVYGTRAEDLAALPLIVNGETASGDFARFDQGVAIGAGVARELGLWIGDYITLISPDGMDTPFGTQPRISDYEVVYIFSVGRFDIDRTRVYMPFAEAQSYFNREGAADEIEVFTDRPQEVDALRVPLAEATAPNGLVWTWRDASGAFLSALDVERRVMFIILSLVVLIAALNIISGLVMLVKNKGRDIGILRTMGLTQGSIMRVFFLLHLRLADRRGRHRARRDPRLPLRLFHPGHPGAGRMGLRRIGLEPRDPLPHRDPGPAAAPGHPRGGGYGARPLLPDHAPAGPQRREAQSRRGAAL